MNHVVIRLHSKWQQVTYLKDWDEVWGTVVIGDPNQAMIFESEVLAERAAERAKSECLDFNKDPSISVTFKVVTIN